VGQERGLLSLMSTTEELLYRKVVGLERGPLSLVSTTEELLDSQSHIATDGQSVSMSWCQAQI
jgi:hypothetical protein